jgi:hypothetical protein
MVQPQPEQPAFAIVMNLAMQDSESATKVLLGSMFP